MKVYLCISHFLRQKIKSIHTTCLQLLLFADKNKGGKFSKKNYGAAKVREYGKIVLVLSTELIV